MLSRILVPLDGSAFAETALPLAAALSRASGAAMELVSAYDPLPPPSAGPAEAAAMGVPVHADALGAVPITTAELSDSLRDERTMYLRDAARRLREGTEVDAEVVLVEGRADHAIRARVEASGADLVVMATHGRGPLERAWLGSVADRLVRDLHMPILVVRPIEGERVDLSVPIALNRMVVTLDGSKLAEGVLDTALELAEVLGLPIVLKRVIGVRMDLESPYIPHAAHAYHEQVERERTEAREYLADLAEDLRSRGATIAALDVDQGPAARTILDTLDPDGRDLLAMATHGRGGLRRMILGSVSDKVVRAAVGPVLLVRPDGEE
jgi:nucleotide-binding universal stress UspA family protein